MNDNDYKEFIIDAVRSTGYRLTEMTPLESIFFRKRVLGKFTESYEHYALWENLKEPFGVREPHSWEWIDEFLREKEFYFFFEEDNDETIYIILENQSLSKLLREMPIKVFYVTNDNLDYIISYNDHEYLIACGIAETWLRNKVADMTANGWKDYNQVLREKRESK